MKQVLLGIVGMGGIGSLHARQITAANSRNFRLAAVCDLLEGRARRAGEEYGVPHFTDAGALYASGRVNAVLIGTPHYAHGPLAIRAARAGLHVLCEKPLASSVSHARAMIAECRKRRRVFGSVLHHRTRAVMQTARRLVQSGALGEVFRVQMVCSNWFRTQAYYDSGDWRGTWDGEGGGVLINQAPHHLDLFQWVGLGLPRRVIATVATREHRIEVEDTANILCDYGEGKVGYIYATTAEQPGMEQFILSGDKATMIIEKGGIRVGRLKVPVKKYTYASKTADAVYTPAMKQSCAWKDVPVKPDPATDGRHIEIVRGFVRQIQTGRRQYAPGEEALAELELSNAAYLSGFSGGRPVELPVDAAKMDRLLARLERERATGKGGGLRRKYQAEFRRLMRT